MKKIYWRPRGVPQWVLASLALLAVGVMAMVELVPGRPHENFRKTQLQAAELADRAMNLLRQARIDLGHPLDPDTDPAGSGMIGVIMSPVTTDAGLLTAKQASANPNFAAVIVEMLQRAGVRRYDYVAVGCSGSFPALNVCTYAACKAMGVRPIIITSASASQFGANIPGFLWLDMEARLRDQGVFEFKSAAASLGGVDDLARGLSAEGRAELRASAERHGVPLLESASLGQCVEERLRVYQAAAVGDMPISAYVNVGGGSVSVGRRLGKRSYQPGLNFQLPAGGQYVDSVMTRFITDGVPVLHLVRIEHLAAEYGLPVRPEVMPSPGEGGVYDRNDYNRVLAAAGLVVIVGALYLAVRSAWASRLLGTTTKGREDLSHEPMV